MLLPGGRGHLSRRTALALWAALVLLAHAWTWQGWRDWSFGPALPPLERLQVKLQRPLQAAPPPQQAAARQLESGAVRPRARSPLADLQAQANLKPLPALSPLPPLDAPPEPEPQATALGPDGVGPEWPLSTRLRYEVTGHYRGEVHGDAEVEWLRQGQRYQVRLKISIGPSVAPLVSRQLVSEGVITPEGISPRRYDEETRLLFGPLRRQSLLVQDGRLQLAHGRETQAPVGLQDSASQFVHLAWLSLTGRVLYEPGVVVEMPLALPRLLLNWRYELVGGERTETPLGKTQLWHWRPQGAVPPGALAAEVWLAPAMQYLPMRIRISQGSDTWVLLSLREPPQQEEALAAENAASGTEGSPR